MKHKDVAFTVIRGTFDCPHCDKAIELLTTAGMTFSVRKLGMADLVLKQAELSHPTVPLIQHGAHFVGGAKQLEEYLS